MRYLIMFLIVWFGSLYLYERYFDDGSYEYCSKSEIVLSVTPIGHKNYTSYYWTTKNKAGETWNIIKVGDFQCIEYSIAKN